MLTPKSQALASPRLTIEYLKSLIVSCEYSFFKETGTTVCSVKLVNGFSVTESVVCGNSDVYDASIGEKHALAKVLDIVRKFEYYLLKQRIYEQNLKGRNP